MGVYEKNRLYGDTAGGISLTSNKWRRPHQNEMSARTGDTIVIRHAERLGRGDSTLYTDNLRSAEASRHVTDGTGRAMPGSRRFPAYRRRWAGDER